MITSTSKQPKHWYLSGIALGIGGGVEFAWLRRGWNASIASCAGLSGIVWRGLVDCATWLAVWYIIS